MTTSFQQELVLALHAFRAGDLVKAESKANMALKSNPRSADTLLLLGVIRGLQGRHAEAEQFLRKAAEFEKKNNFIFFNLAKSLSEQGRNLESIEWHKKALALSATHAEAWLNYGKSLYELKDINNAMKAYDRAIAIDKNLAEAYANKAACLQSTKLYEESIALHDYALALNPNLVESWSNRGDALNNLMRYGESLRSYQQAFKLEPNTDFLLGSLIHAQMKICDWTDLDDRLDRLRTEVEAGYKCSNPLPILGLFDSPKLQYSAAETYAKTRYKLSNQKRTIVKFSRGKKIRLAYFSMDFREHAVAHLTADLYDLHDRNKFEVYAFSFGANTQDPIRKRLEQSFDKFIDVHGKSEIEIARISRELNIDIAIDLGGHTKDSLPQIFLERAAPIQINYLGYPGSWGDHCMDYFIGDKTTITDANNSYFSEKIVYMPEQFQVNPRSRAVSEQSREKAGLKIPENTIVYCCFNNNWKITPAIFKSWMRILHRVPNSVLWLYAENSLASRNLLINASKYGISNERLIFANRVPDTADHLARYKLADLFLDTFPYGAHTTASDALWVGLPVLTLCGNSFASRVAASLLENVGLPELIALTPEQYEALAITLATNPEKLNEYRKRLLLNRATTPLFNTHRFTKHLESAYLAMYERLHAGLTPDHINIKP